LSRSPRRSPARCTTRAASAMSGVSGMQARRMARELSLLSTSPPPGVAAWPREDGSAARLDALDAEIVGAPGTPYAGGVFRLRVSIPPEYPLRPPAVRFVTRIYHPNIDAAGRICLDTLNMPPKGAWKPSLNVATVLASVQLLMSHPNPDDGLMADITDEFRRFPDRFHATATAWTARHASGKAEHASAPTADTAVPAGPAATSAAPAPMPAAANHPVTAAPHAAPPAAAAASADTAAAVTPPRQRRMTVPAANDVVDDDDDDDDDDGHVEKSGKVPEEEEEPLVVVEESSAEEQLEPPCRLTARSPRRSLTSKVPERGLAANSPRSAAPTVKGLATPTPPPPSERRPSPLRRKRPAAATAGALATPTPPPSSRRRTSLLRRQRVAAAAAEPVAAVIDLDSDDAPAPAPASAPARDVSSKRVRRDVSRQAAGREAAVAVQAVRGTRLKRQRK
jgi:ubiquitin-conjugating enzyme E2 T